jgi:putative ABC transport system permease protein
MYSLELSKQLLQELWKRKLRTFLGIFGIFWGTVSVILLLALGSGYYTASVKSLSSIAGGAMMFFPGTTSKPHLGYPSGRRVMIKASQIMKMAKRIPEIKYISATVDGGGTTIAHLEKTTQRSVSGVNWAYSEIWKLDSKMTGRFISFFDIQKGLHVVVLGSDVKQNLFGKGRAEGEKVEIWGIPFTVIGALKSTSDSGSGGWMSQKILIPYTTLISVKGDKNITTFSAAPQTIADIPMIKSQVRNYLGGILHFSPGDNSALNSPDLTKLMRYFTIFFLVIEVFLGACGVVTLIVGGIGIANMMFLIVTERTREIGLRMALGATQRDILFLVMLETSLIVALGGFAGIVFSQIVIMIFDQISLPAWLGSPEIDYWTMLVTVFILFVVTFFAGIFPARSASKMQPVEALSF